jgi:hypothetical protein
MFKDGVDDLNEANQAFVQAEDRHLCAAEFPGLESKTFEATTTNGHKSAAFRYLGGFSAEGSDTLAQ